MTEGRSEQGGWRAQLYSVIFGTETPSGKRFDVALLVFILCSVLVVMLESVSSIRETHGGMLRTLEWVFTVVFSLEYLARLVTSPRPMAYAMSFFGLVDLLAIAPTYLSLVIAGTQSLTVVRAIRLLRVFRVLKLVHFMGEARALGAALVASRRKIIVFVGAVLTLVLVIGSSMYLIEGEEHGFTSIPQSVYWAIVTLTTVGYGDVAPGTPLGKLLASVVMVLGYGIIAVPTGIVTAEMVTQDQKLSGNVACDNCGAGGHGGDAHYCRRCGVALVGAKNDVVGSVR